MHMYIYVAIVVIMKEVINLRGWKSKGNNPKVRDRNRNDIKTCMNFINQLQNRE